MSKGDTPNHSQQSKCLSCKQAAIIRGFAESELIVRCSVLERMIPFPVYECSWYEHKLDPDLHELKAIAYILENKDSKIGFVKPKPRRYD